MRPLGITMRGVNGTGGVIQHNSNSTMAELVYKWNVWETQTMVLLSFTLQLFLLAAGRLRRRNTNGVLKALIWLAYVGADFVAVYALGLFSQYEDKYSKLGRESFGDTLPFLWVPFLLVHLGGQDSITAFSLEDNNLWLRHLLNLTAQGVVALYVFWKSIHRINYSILIPAMLVFVSGIIKYGEKVWALKSASRNGLGDSVMLNSPAKRNTNRNDESYARQTVLLARGLFVGRIVLQLGDKAGEKLKNEFINKYGDIKKKLKMVVMELGMMFDLLYTKANVLQRRTGVLFRCASHILMVVAFILFQLRSKKGANNHHRVNVAITYTLFAGALFMDSISIILVLVSPWTRAYLNRSRSGHGLSKYVRSPFPSTSSHHGLSMGQYNFMDYAMAMKCNPTILSKVIYAFGLDKIWRNLRYVHHINDDSNVDRIISCVLEIIGTPYNEYSLDRILNFTLCLPFEQALYRLHIYTDLHISKHFAPTNSDVTPVPNGVRIMQLKEECETLSNYMMYLMVVYPSMLPISTAAQDLEPELLEFVTGRHGKTKLQILEHFSKVRLGEDMPTCFPFETEQFNGSFHLEQSLEKIKEIWLRLLIYAAGKCSGEIHARQLSDGGELITFVWLLMVHHGLGDVAQELRLWKSDMPDVPQPRFITLSIEDIEQQPEPLYAFVFRDQQAAREREQIQLAHMVQDIMQQVLRAEQSVVEGTEVIGDLIQQFLSGETQLYGATAPGGVLEQDEAGTSGAAGADVNVETHSEINDNLET